MVIKELNEELRFEKIKESDRLIKYLETELKKAKVAEIRELLGRLLQTQMESNMLARLDADYVFAIIDPPTSPNLPSGPNQPLILILSILLGGAIGAAIVWGKWLITKKKIN